MSNEADELSEINRKQRERMLQLKSRTENMMKRPSPLINDNFSSGSSNHLFQVPTSNKKNTYDFLKEYESSKTNNNEDNYGEEKSNSMDWNSTLFKYDPENLQNQSSDPHNSSLSSGGGNHMTDSQDLIKNQSLLSKIDELLKGNKKESKMGVQTIYDGYLSKKGFDSSSISDNLSSISDFDAKTSKHNRTLTPSKLKTIQEEEKIPLSIETPELDQKNKKKVSNGNPMRRPPLSPLASSSTIERQKKKLQDTMKEMRKEQKESIEIDKDSFVLELSDNETEPENHNEAQKKDSFEDHSKMDRKEKDSKLRMEKERLVEELEKIERELRQLEKEEEEDEDEYR